MDRNELRARRLSAYDQHCLRVETAARPGQIGILAVLDRPLDLEAVRAKVHGRLAAVPELTRVVHWPGRLAGGPLWIDDPAFGIDRHVEMVDLAPPGDESALLAMTEVLMGRPLDRARPLWHLWLIGGLAGERAALLVVLHHALADGLTAMRMVRDLLVSTDAALAVLPPAVVPLAGVRAPGRAASAPRWADLVLDHARSVIGSLAGLARPSTWRLAAAMARSGWGAIHAARRSPVSSLNGPVGRRRRMRVLRLELKAVKRVARACDCGANDVVLGLVAAGVRALLAARGEPVEQLKPRVGVAVALFSRGRGRAPGNDIGSLLVPLPLADQDPAARLREVAAERERAQAGQLVASEPLIRAWFSRIGFVRRAMASQRLVNLAETYLPGPPGQIEALGARVLDLVPVAPLSGNLALSFVALSYARSLAIAVRADADRFPDLSVLMAGMDREWQALLEPASRAYSIHRAT